MPGSIAKRGKTRARALRLLPHAALIAVLAGAFGAERTSAVDRSAPDWWTAQLGGLTGTANSITQNAFGQPIALDTSDLRRFTFGNRIFNTHWVAAPASVDGFDGLGPVFNRVSCSGCHTRDGRGQPPNEPGGTLESMLVRISIPGQDEHGAVLPVPHYGDQLNEKALPGVPAEGRTIVHYTEHEGRYPDGTRYRLAVPAYEFADLAFGAWPRDARFSPRVAPPIFGLGLLEAVPEAVVLAAADPDDADGDGISGRPNRVWDAVEGKTALGRFGWKANQPSLRQQNAGAALGDIGLTSSVFRRQNVADGQTAAAATPDAREPELKDEYLERLTFYVQALAVPAARNIDDTQVHTGARLFEHAQCAACHLPTLKTGDQPTVPALGWQMIHPFTDLLLHDMGDDLADGRSDFEAGGNEWRTPPLWGIGLTAVVNRHTRFLHDGRARSLEEAILWHGGEAAQSRDSFMHMRKSERNALLVFLNNM
jgi:CxxC motif-containing protein (DUF1111 family)